MNERIIILIAEQLGIEREAIKPEQKLVEDLNADSLDMVELAIAVEDEFDIQLPDNMDESNDLTVQSLFDLVTNIIAK